jgi:peroxiredoxin
MDSAHSHTAFARALGLPFPLYSDWSREAAGAFDILLDESWGYRPSNARAAFVVDAAGVVRWARVDQGVVHPDELVAALEATRSEGGLP